MATQITVYKGWLRSKKIWVVSRLEAGARKRSYFTSKEVAEAEASRLRDQLAKVGEVWNSLPGSDRDALISAWNSAKTRGLNIQSLIASGSQSHPGDGPKLSDLITELLAAKKSAGRAEDYLGSLELILGWFAKGRESMRIAKIQLADVESFLNLKPIDSRPTLRARLSTLFRFSVRRKYRTDNPCDQLETVTTTRKPIQILTVEQVAKCLKFLWEELKPHKHSPAVNYRHALPWFVLSTFCGLRPEEAEKTTRSDINIREGWVRVEAQTTKVRQRRVVYPMKPAIKLLASVLDDGRLPIDPQSRRRAIRKLRAVAGWSKWPKDVTRHSAASYWLGSGESASHVAEMLGNSESVLKRDYKALVTREEAAEFWKVSIEK